MIISMTVITIIGEICLTLFFPIDDPYQMAKDSRNQNFKYIESQFLPHQDYTFYPEPELSRMSKQAHFTTNNMGFRGSDIIQPKPKGEFRIFMIGGSTTECLFLDDTLATTFLLERYINRHLKKEKDIRVYNAGKSGDRSYDHIAMISQRLVHLQPDMLIVFAGINDLTAAIYEADYTHPFVESGATLSLGRLLIYLATEFQLPRRFYYLIRRFSGGQSDDDILRAISYRSEYKRMVELRRSHPVSDKFPRIDLDSYRSNLKSIIGLARVHNIRLLLMTQATTWNSEIDPETTDWQWATFRNGITYSEQNLETALKEYNGVMRQLAAENKLLLFDLAGSIPKSLEFFYDDCHFNINGAEWTAEKLGVYLIEENVFGND